MSDTNKRIAARILEEVFGQGNMAAIDELVAADAVGHDAAMPGPIEGRDGLKQAVAGYRTAFPDLSMAVVQQVAEGDLVTTRWSSSGTQQGELFGVAPTGIHATVTGITIDRIENGQVVESWTNWDTFGLLMQLGAIPAPALA